MCLAEQDPHGIAGFLERDGFFSPTLFRPEKILTSMKNPKPARMPYFD
jgi:hypothetical protein